MLPTATPPLPRRRLSSLSIAVLPLMAVLAVPLAALLSLRAALAAEPPPASPGPTLAVEDTMHTEVPEVLVKAPRVTLDEILDRVARGEARRDSSLTDQQFTASFRVISGIGGKKGPELLSERIVRVYKKRPDKVRSVTLR